MMNIITFDLEEWYLEKKLHNGRSYRYQQFEEAFATILDELSQHEIKATFFCLGKMATDFPQVIRVIASEGHEIGCHSNEHIWLNRMTDKQLREDTCDAINALEDVSGQKVISYRAPAFSITQNNKWAVEVLADCGIENDASIFPTNRDLGGYKNFPQDTPCIISYGGAKLKEYPVSLISFMGKRLVYSGGGYFRMLPYLFVNRMLKTKKYNICYFHLNDLINQKFALKTKIEYEEYFKEPGTLKNRIMRYVKSNIGTGSAHEKMARLLFDHQFVNIQEAGCLIDWSQANVIKL